MRKTILALVAALLLVGVGQPPAAAQATGDPDRAAIVAVIESQIEAFRVDDDERAFSFASPGIRRMFGTPGRFMAMVRNGYQAVYRPRDVAFLDLVPSDRGPTQVVQLVGPDGRVVIGLYFMQAQPDGSWKINGVQLLDQGDLAT